MTEIRPDMVYVPSEDIVAREIAGELIIVPLTTGIGTTDDDLFTLNETGRAIWQRLDGTSTLKGIAAALAAEYEAAPGDIEKDVLGLVEELVKRRIVVAVSNE